ncbi:enoyl-CoA hydratase-related protein [Cognatishimia sp.]|uniref:enoyl-CoA hydratase-related protein n=1 Tax=Cognatishimia sp. TaxID=2211648 RepID=UPI003514CD22
MEYQAIDFSVQDGYAQITLNRPEKLNAINTQMRAEITHAVRDVSQNHESLGARALVLTGAGRGFCAGQDLGGQGSVATMDLERVLRDEYTPMLRAIVDCEVPTVAAVHGAAAGAGANLALICDVVIASESAYFMQAFTRIGLMPDAGGTFMMPRLAGNAKAMGAALFAEKISARQADDWGLIWEAVSDAEFDAHWKARAAHLGAGPSGAYYALKQAIRATWDNNLDDQLALEAKLQGKCGKSRDFQEGSVALFEKRPAAFEGR